MAGGEGGEGLCKGQRSTAVRLGGPTETLKRYERAVGTA